jgi:ubiquinone/menaquinone biosynthesis C-methylase UbiE
VSDPEADKAARVKAAVRKNFAESPEAYDRFEDRWGLFGELTRRLIEAMDLAPSARVLDVGCGSGASCRPLLEAVPRGKIVGLDISPEMIDSARRALGDRPGLRFVVGDAAEMDACVSGRFDAVLYTASAFLIPDLGRSLAAARRVLEPGGRIGLVFMDAVVDEQGRNLLHLAEDRAQTGANFKRAIYLQQAIDTFEVFCNDVRHLAHEVEMSREALRQFYSIPAQSAGLYPRLPFEQRQDRLDELFIHLPPTVRFRWPIMVGRAKN